MSPSIVRWAADGAGLARGAPRRSTGRHRRSRPLPRAEHAGGCGWRADPAVWRGGAAGVSGTPEWRRDRPASDGTLTHLVPRRARTRSRPRCRPSVVMAPRCGCCSIAASAAVRWRSGAWKCQEGRRSWRPPGSPNDGFAHGIIGVAPDDSLVAIAASGPLLDRPVTVGRCRSTAASWASWLRPRWARGQARPSRPSSRSPRSRRGSPHGPRCAPSISYRRAGPAPATGPVAARSRSPIEGAVDPRSTVKSAPIELTQGLGVLLSCSGPSDVVITADIPLDDLTRILSPLSPGR